MKCHQFILFSSLLLTSAVLADVNEDIEALKDSVAIPGLNTTGLPTSDEAKEIFKKKCIKEGHSEAYDKAALANEDLMKCIQNLVDVEVLKQEIEDAKPTGDLDIVFKKYCRKSPLLKECISNFTTVIEPCFNEKEQANIKLVLNITESLTSFICYKEGDRIALFIAEGGPECFSDKKDAIQDCVNSSMTKYIPAEAPTLDNLPELLLKPEQCDDMAKMQDCIVKKLEECEQPTPANIAESLFRFIKQVTPCGKKEGILLSRSAPPVAEDSKTSAASSVSSTVVLSLILAIFAKFFM